MSFIEFYADILKIAEELNAPRYSYKGKPVVLMSEGGNLSQVHYEGEDYEQSFWVKPADLKPIVPKIKKQPGYLSVDELTWDSEGRLAWFLGWLAGAGNARLYLETTPSQENAVENLYHSLTGLILQPTKGLYNIAMGNKFGTEASVTFAPSEIIPDEIAKLQEQRPGFINRTPFFWALIKLGFRLVRGPQEAGIIRASVPVSQQNYFDAGFRGISPQ